MHILLFYRKHTEIASVVGVKDESVLPNIVEGGPTVQLRLLLTHKVLPKWSKYHEQSVITFIY